MKQKTSKSGCLKCDYQCGINHKKDCPKNVYTCDPAPSHLEIALASHKKSAWSRKLNELSKKHHLDTLDLLEKALKEAYERGRRDELALVVDNCLTRSHYSGIMLAKYFTSGKVPPELEALKKDAWAREDVAPYQ